MNVRGEEPRTRAAKKSKLEEKIAQFYYSQGLLCSTYPITVLIVTTTIVLICCFPLLNLPIPGDAPRQTWISSENITEYPTPYCYVQQVVIRSTVMPWEEDLHLGDAFRAPIYEAFKLLEIIRNFQNDDGRSLGHLCLHVEAIRNRNAGYRDVLPQYSCLVLSPANLWKQDVQIFAKDNTLLTTVFNQHNFQKGKTSVSEMLFGMRLYDAGIKRYPFRIRQRIIQFAVTLFLKEYDQKFIEGLKMKLATFYPLHQNISNDYRKNLANDTVFIEYPGEIDYIEFIPITVAFILLFVYYYFSIRKIEMITSKISMAFMAVITVLGSLIMTLGLCFFFGLTLNLKGKEVFPYLVLLVGLENVLVLTKSIVSTPLHLDVKIRIAQGLSKEGWSITKNILLEITILTFGLFTFVPIVQEFCIFSIVGLFTDYFLQMFFFTTILGMDIRKSENLSEINTINFRNYRSFYDKTTPSLNRSRSHPRLSLFPTDVIAGQAQNAQEKKIPKRLRLVHIWARTRFFQRAFMILMVTWICTIAYNSGIIERYLLSQTTIDEINIDLDESNNYSTINLIPIPDRFARMNEVTQNPLDYHLPNNTAVFEKLKHPSYAMWLKLSLQHWPSIFRKYNLSLNAQTIVMLPNIKLSHIVTPDQAAILRNPDERYHKFQWHALAAALDPLDFGEMENPDKEPPQTERPLYPTSVLEIGLTTILCIISIIVLAYVFFMFYRCICSRNYAEWRASWFNEKGEDVTDDQVLLEALPMVLDGHQQQIESIASDGLKIVSACLGGYLKVWDLTTGEIIMEIDRKRHFPQIYYKDTDCDENSSDYESGSPPSHYPFFPRLQHRINLNFTDLEMKKENYDTKRDFNESFRHLYFNGRKSRKSVAWIRDYRQDCQIYDYPENSHRLSPVWCMDFVENLIVVGCADGRLEFWDGTTGKLRCVMDDDSHVGITIVKIIGSKVIVSRLYGTLNIYHLQTDNHGCPVDWIFSCAYRRTHVRTGSVGSMSEDAIKQDELKCVKTFTIKAHQQPITCLDCEGGRLLTGSQDHTLKVFRIDDGSPLYTLHGHCGPITCLFIDRICPATSGSGSQDGMLCVWDLLTGTCMYSVQAHDGSVISLIYSASYVISLGTDERLCVWERFQGHLLNTISFPQVFASQMLMLAPHLVITARTDGLSVWDVRSGDCVRTIDLGRSPFVFVKQLLLLNDTVVCDYGNQLRIVRFPLITHKFD